MVDVWAKVLLLLFVVVVRFGITVVGKAFLLAEGNTSSHMFAWIVVNEIWWRCRAVCGE